MNAIDTQERLDWAAYMSALNKKLSLREGTKEFNNAARYADVLLKKYQLTLKTKLLIAVEQHMF